MEKSEIISKMNYKLGTSFESMDEICGDLSQKLADIYSDVNDMQSAFDLLNFVIGDNLLSSLFEYKLSDGGDWSVCVYGDLTQDMIKSLNVCGYKVSDADDLCAIIEHNVLDTESNVGCDALTALKLELEDMPNGYDWESILKIDVPDGNPVIALVEDGDDSECN